VNGARWAIGGAVAVAVLFIVAAIVVRPAPIREHPHPVPKPANAPERTQQSFPCAIVPRETVAAVAAVNGRIAAVFAKIGQTVTEGQVLARIESQALSSAAKGSSFSAAGTETEATRLAQEMAQARAESARLQREVARARDRAVRAEPVFKRQELLNREGATPRLTFEKAEAEWENAARELAAAEESSRQADNAASRLADQVLESKRMLTETSHLAAAAQTGMAATEVHAPSAGLVISSNASVSSPVQPNQELFQIAVNPNLLRAEFRPSFTLPQQQPVFLAISGLQIRTTVTESTPERTFADFESSTAPVSPGMPCVALVRIK